MKKSTSPKAKFSPSWLYLIIGIFVIFGVALYFRPQAQPLGINEISYAPVPVEIESINMVCDGYPAITNFANQCGYLKYRKVTFRCKIEEARTLGDTSTCKDYSTWYKEVITKCGWKCSTASPTPTSSASATPTSTSRPSISPTPKPTSTSIPSPTTYP